MKKILTIFALIAFTGVSFAATQSFASKVNNGLNTIDKKEQALNKKIDDAQAKREMQRKEAAKIQYGPKAAADKTTAEAKARVDAHKKAVENEKNYWNDLLK